MTNFQAAIGLAQLEDIDIILERKRTIAKFYRENIKFQAIVPNVDISSEWMPVFKLEKANYYKLMCHSMDHGIEIRPSFYPIHQMPEFDGYCPFKLDNAVNSIDRHFILPCYPALTNDDLGYIAEKVNKFYE